MRRFWAQSLRRQLLIAILLLLVPVVAAAIWSGIVTYQERLEDIRDQTAFIADTTATWVNREIVTLDGTADALTRVDAIRALDPVSSADLLRQTLSNRPNVVDIVLARADGTVVARGRSPAQVDIGTAWVSRVIDSKERIIVPLETGLKATPRFILGVPVKTSTNATAAAVGYVLNLGPLQSALAAMPVPEGSVITITDAESRVLARRPDPAEHVGRLLNPGQRALADRRPARETDVDGVERIYGEAIADEGPWLVTVGIPVSLAYGKTVSLWTRGFAVLALCLAGWLAVALVVSKRLTNSVSHLDAAAQRIAAGDFSPIEQKPMLSREFAELQTAFDLMLQRFNATRHALDEQMAEERGVRQELESLQGQVIRQERLAAVGQLVSGVAHEINNPLQAILGFSELLQMQPNVPDSVKSDLRLIQKESARACGIIRNLALFARQQPGSAAPVLLTDVIASVAELRQRRLQTEDIVLHIDDRAVQHVMAVATELQQVVLNFVVNAEQAIVGSGRLPGRITIRTFDKDNSVVLEVEDTGPGIPSEHQAKLFQPFFTTKPVGQGTGLGLSVSYGIIDSLRGHIGYRQAPAGGAVFYFALPAVAEAAE